MKSWPILKLSQVGVTVKRFITGDDLFGEISCRQIKTTGDDLFGEISCRQIKTSQSLCIPVLEIDSLPTCHI